MRTLGNKKEIFRSFHEKVTNNLTEVFSFVFSSSASFHYYLQASHGSLASLQQLLAQLEVRWFLSQFPVFHHFFPLSFPPTDAVFGVRALLPGSIV